MSEEPVSNESVTDIIRKFQNPQSIIKIKKNRERNFSFSPVEFNLMHLRPFKKMIFR